MPISWSSAFATGVEEVDQQHKTLFEQINKLSQAMQSGQGQDSLSETLAFVEDYVRKHFRDEERYMDRFDCPVAEQNKRAHAEFLTTFGALRNRYDAGLAKSPIVIEIHSFLSKWLVDHIASIDSKLKECVVPA